MSWTKRGLLRFKCLALVVSVAMLGSSGWAQGAALPTVVFVCEHGSVKSLMAASYFNRLAREQGLAVEALARGMNPDPAVPNSVARALQADGFDVGSFQPRRLERADVSRAARVVAIGVDISAIAHGMSTRVDRWDAIPAASQDYAKARAALMQHITRLLHQLSGHQ